MMPGFEVAEEIDAHRPPHAPLRSASISSTLRSIDGTDEHDDLGSGYGESDRPCNVRVFTVD